MVHKAQKTIYYLPLIIEGYNSEQPIQAAWYKVFGKEAELLPSRENLFLAPVCSSIETLRIALLKSFTSLVSLPSSQKLAGKAENFNSLITWSFW